MTAAQRHAVLFVDDEPLVLRGLQRMLRGQCGGWTAHFAASGEEALELLSREPVDVLVTDLRMPGMGGAVLLRAASQRYPHMVRIVLSGEMNPHRALNAAGCAHQFLAKPCDFDTLKKTLDRVFSLRRLVEDHGLKRLLSQIDTLPSLPSLYAELIAEMRSPQASFRRMGELIAQDASMAAKILQMVNSAFFGLPRRIVTPAEAVAMLGFETVKALVLSVKIFEQFDPQRVQGFSLESLWSHSLETSRCARQLCVVEKLARQQQDEAFTAGILHDLGRLILAQNFPAATRELLTRARRQPLWRLEIERFGASHADLGAYLMGLWGAGEDVVAAIAFHHRPSQAPSANRLVAMVHVADHLAQPPGEEAAGDIDQDYLKQLNLAERLAFWQELCRDKPEERPSVR
jgi:HD-like signal output (HDOD) protein/ActR/RegA family two-component response regulator